MDRKQLIIVSGIVVLGLMLAFPLTWIFTEPGVSQSQVRVAVSEGAILQTDASGVDWMITPARAGRAAADPNGAQAKPVLVVRTDVLRASSREMLIGLVVQSRDGRNFLPWVVKGGVRQPAPKLRIVNEAGKVLLDDSFKYG